MKVFRQKKLGPSKVEDDYQSVSKKFHFRKLCSGQADFSFDYHAEHVCPECRKRFDQPTMKNSAIFEIFCSAKDPLDT